MSTTPSTTCIDAPPRRPCGRLALAGLALAVSGALAAPALAVSGALAAPEAVSDDGAWRLVGGADVLQILDTTGRELRRVVTAPIGGGDRSAVAWVRWVAPRRSFVVGFTSLPEIWEVSTDPRAEPIYNGWVHDYRMGEGISEPGFLGARRTRLTGPLPVAVPDASGAFWLGRAADDAQGRAVLLLVQIDVRRAIGRFVVDGDPDVSQARAGRREGREVIAVPDRRGGPELVVDVRAARLEAR